MKIVLLSIIICFAAFRVSVAAPSDSIAIMHHEVGLSVSSITGFGVSYRYNFDNQFYIKTVGFIFPNNIESRTGLNSSIGLEIQRNFVQTPNSRFYGFVGGSFWSNNYTETSYGTTTDETTIFGAGIGIELAISEHFAVNVNMGLQNASTNYISTWHDTYYHPHSRFGMGGGLGFSYQF
jgi:hypothetical protein